MRTLEEKFWRKVHVDSSDKCWLWAGKYHSRKSVGILHHERKRLEADRLSYEIHNGKLNKNFTVIKTCRRYNCVNPKHLVTRRKAI